MQVRNNNNLTNMRLRQKMSDTIFLRNSATVFSTYTQRSISRQISATSSGILLTCYLLQNWKNWTVTCAKSRPLNHNAELENVYMSLREYFSFSDTLHRSVNLSYITKDAAKHQVALCVHTGHQKAALTFLIIMTLRYHPRKISCPNTVTRYRYFYFVNLQVFIIIIIITNVLI